MRSSINGRTRSRMRIATARWVFVIALSCLFFYSSQFFGAPSPMPAPTSAGDLFREKPFGPIPPPAPTPEIKTRDFEESKPIPVGWYIGGGVVAGLMVALLLWGAARAWHSSNLFDRQYSFPTGVQAALRLGGDRCGGHMATISLGSADLSPTLETKDT